MDGQKKINRPKRKKFVLAFRTFDGMIAKIGAMRCFGWEYDGWFVTYNTQRECGKLSDQEKYSIHHIETGKFLVNVDSLELAEEIISVLDANRVEEEIYESNDWKLWRLTESSRNYLVEKLERFKGKYSGRMIYRRNSKHSNRAF